MKSLKINTLYKIKGFKKDNDGDLFKSYPYPFLKDPEKYNKNSIFNYIEVLPQELFGGCFIVTKIFLSHKIKYCQFLLNGKQIAFEEYERMLSIFDIIELK